MMRLREIVDFDALSNRKGAPGQLVSALNVEEADVRYFDSGDNVLTINHMIAIGSLSPSFPMTKIEGRNYWDSELFDNWPSGAVLRRLDEQPKAECVIYVVNRNNERMDHTGLRSGNMLQIRQTRCRTSEGLMSISIIEEIARNLGGLAVVGAPVHSQADLALAIRNQLPLSALKQTDDGSIAYTGAIFSSAVYGVLCTAMHHSVRAADIADSSGITI